MYEDGVRMEYINKCNYYFSEDKSLIMNIDAFFKIPKSTSKKKKMMMLSNDIRPTKKPDMDNIIKIVADALNGIAYYDDKQIIECTIRKYYSNEPRIKVSIYEADLKED